MGHNYHDKLESRIGWVLQNDKLSFQELVRECKGAYPMEVYEIVHSNKYQIETKEVLRYSNADCDLIRNYVTSEIESNPVLCSWYFSLPTCRKIINLYSWSNKRILFLGMPRLFEFFLQNVKNAKLTLVDLDQYVLSQLKNRYGHEYDFRLVNADLNNTEFSLNDKFDFVFLDPPWYMEYYNIWLQHSYSMIDTNGQIIFPIFQELTRPEAEKERKKLLDSVKKHTDQYLAISDFVEYEIPTFEKRELENCELQIDRPWKKADLILIKEISRDYHRCIKGTSEKLADTWEEIDIFRLRIFINGRDISQKEELKIRYLSDKGAYLKNPSKRNQEIQLANMLTSRGQGYIVYSPEKLIVLLKKIKWEIESGVALKQVIETVRMDEISRKILFEILESGLC